MAAFAQTKYTGGTADGYASYSRSMNMPMEYKFAGGIEDGYAKQPCFMPLPMGYKYGGGIADGCTLGPMAESRVEIKLFLEGPYSVSTHLMNAALAVPTASPYSEDARSIASIPEGIVDWVLVQLRTSPDGFTVAAKSALLHQNGRVVADDGVTPYFTDRAGIGGRYIAIRHRNHLAAMSASAHALLTTGSSVYDFSAGIGQYYGTDANRAKLLESGVYGSNAGDADGSGTVDASDRSATWNGRNQSGYLNADCNLSGTVDASDRSITWNNRNKATGVP